MFPFGEYGGGFTGNAEEWIQYISDLIYYLGVVSLAVAAWILQARGVYVIAKRRAIRHPWLAWLPVGCDWVLGCISDQYRYVVAQQVKHKRRWLPILNVAASMVLAAMVAYVVLCLMPAGVALTQRLLKYLVLLVMLLVLLAISVPATVINYKALYDLYASCRPEKRVLFLLLSLFLGIAPFFVFACRGQDQGMPAPEPAICEPQPPQLPQQEE